jgi:hypothetical protein
MDRLILDYHKDNDFDPDLAEQNIYNIIKDRNNQRKPASTMTDLEIINYINSKQSDQIIYDSWDDERETAEEKRWSQGPYRLALLSIDRSKPWIAKPRIMVELFRAGYSRYAAEKYTILSQMFGEFPIASGELEQMEQYQQEMKQLKTKITIR